MEQCLRIPTEMIVHLGIFYPAKLSLRQEGGVRTSLSDVVFWAHRKATRFCRGSGSCAALSVF